jgi:predicted Zn-dependent protease
VLFRSDDYHGAINIGIDLLEMQPDNSMNYLYLADLYTLVGKEDISLELLTRAAKMDPENSVIQDLLSKFVVN